MVAKNNQNNRHYSLSTIQQYTRRRLHTRYP